jgi:hypothetical protein
MPGKKPLFKNRNDLVNEVCKREKTTDEASVNAYRQAFKRLVELDIWATVQGFKSPIGMLRKEALNTIKKKVAK